MTELPQITADGDKRPQRCETCRHWDRERTDEPEGDEARHGECHRFPPGPVDYRIFCEESENEAYNRRWPMTYDRDWCGEWGPLPIGESR